MANHPIKDCIRQARQLVQTGNAVVLQKFTCAGCGSRQTMDKPNTFYTHGVCEECGKLTDIQADGCNYLLHTVATPLGKEQLHKLYGDFEPSITLVDCNDSLPI